MFFPYIQIFELVFVKKDFDILSDYCKQNYTIELVSRAEPKLSEIYILLPVEQSKLDVFLTKNLYISLRKMIAPFSSYRTIYDTKYFTRLDIYWDFNNVQTKSRDEQKTVFCTNIRYSSHLIIQDLVRQKFQYISQYCQDQRRWT